jgi:hypothetical protein
MGQAMTVALLFRAPGEDHLPPGQWTQGCAPTPLGAWAWLHTLRTGEVFQCKFDMFRWADEEQAAWLKSQPRPKPRLLDNQRRLDVRKLKPAPVPDGPMIA